ncbi:AEC family transporter [Aestuariimicrobium ganziense]|uniref:AEC family transporter n=1 Tax=Aestuariimicrobium ganziense TaxID=2773677 RepID=UPI0019445C3B|nr:AEC family transporter [Aestuariimicrobium ganziense]
MLDVLSGFATIWIVIGVGWLLAHLKVLDTTGQTVLSRVTFFVGAPALLFTMVAEADVKRIFAMNLVVSALATVASGAIFLLLSLVLWRAMDLPHRVIGTYGAGYVNAANLGIPIAAYVLKDVTWVVPILLIQVLILQPVALSLLDSHSARSTGNKPSMARNLSIPFRNPMTVATLAGLVVNLTNLKLPTVLLDPLHLLGALSVPGMLLAYGISLRLGPMPGRGGQTGPTALAAGLKLLGQPLIAWALARAFGLDQTTTLAVVVIAGLPVAQNVFVWAVRYEKAIVLARDVVFITTIASIPSIMLLSALVAR